MSFCECRLFRYAFFLLLTLFPFCTSSVQAQPSHSDTLAAHNLFQQADSLQFYARLDSSSQLFRRAATQYRQAGAQHRLLDVQINIAENHIQKGNYQQADSAIDEGLRQLKSLSAESTKINYQAWFHELRGWLATEQSRYDLAEKHLEKAQERLSAESGSYPRLQSLVLYRLGELHTSRGNYEQAIDHYLQALDLFNRNFPPEQRFASEVYNSLGVVYQQQGQTDKAKQYYEKSLKIDRQQLGDAHPDIASGLNNLAIIYYYQGDYQRALEYMKQSTSTLSSFWGENHPKIAIGYNNISIVYSEMGKLREAISYMKRSIQIKKRVIGEINEDVAIGYQNLGALYFDIEEYDRAIEYYQQALALHQQIFDGAHPEIANTYANLGEAFTRMQKYEKALSYLEKDLQMNLQLLGSRHPFIADTHTKMGNIQHSQGAYRSALSHYNQAISILTGSSLEQTEITGISLENVSHPMFLMEALEGKGKTHRAIHHQAKRGDALEHALDTYLEASVLINNLQTEYRSNESKLQLGKKAEAIYQAGIETSYELYKKTGDRSQIEYLLYFMEHSKARVLVENLKDADARRFADIPDSLLEKEHHLRGQITRIHQSIRQQTGQKVHIDSISIGGLQDSLFALQRKLNAHIHQLEDSYPKYHRLKYQDLNITTKMIQDDILKPGQNFVEYALGEESLIAIVINQQGTSIHRTAIDSTFERQVRAFRSAIREENAPRFAELSHKLYQQVFAPVEPSLTGSELTIIPDGILNYLPFEVLVPKLSRSGAGNSDFSQFKYLLADYSIKYAPSGRFLTLQSPEAATDEQNSLLALAPIFSELASPGQANSTRRQSNDITSLPLSRYEVQQVDSLMESHGKQARTLLYSEASESAFKQQPLGEFDIIHLATHAYFSSDSSVESGIYFASDAQSPEDGVLLLDEIYNLPLSAQLVVLSACETALGPLMKGEGAMSLARAFQYAGARQLMVSLWKVDDRSTSTLMTRFYRNLLQGNSVPEAARQAKLNLMNDPRYDSPVFWAPFVIIG